MADAQTSGGLLVATPEPEPLLAALARAGVADARRIGEVTAEDPAGTIEVTP
jgi:hydrogenase maturation factor